MASVKRKGTLGHICKNCRPRSAAASPTHRLIKVCTFWHFVHQWQIYLQLCIQFDYLYVYSTPCRGRSWSTLFVMSEGPFSRDAGHILIVLIMGEVWGRILKDRFQPRCHLSLTVPSRYPIFLLNPFSTETVLLVDYWSPITDTLLYT